MNPLTVLNVTANCIVAIAVADVAFRVFGNPTHPIHKNKALLIARKFVSSVVICGAVLNVVTLSTPSWTEVLLNIGFSLNYLYSSLYDRHACPINSANATAVSKQRPSSRSGSAGTAKKSSSSSGARRKRPSA